MKKNLIVVAILLIVAFSCKKENNSSNTIPTLPTLTTTDATSITSTALISGGNISSDGDADVTARGVCWDTLPDPDVNDHHTSDGHGTGTFTSNLTILEGNTTYYLRAYATNSVGTAYGNQITVTTLRQVDIYAAGERDGNGVFWKNGNPISLGTSSVIAFPHSIYVSGNDVYVAGSLANIGPSELAAVWKNGVATHLTDGAHQAWALSVVVSGNDVYVGGFETNANHVLVAMIWKNGVGIPLTDGTHTARVNSVFILGNDVYAAGYEEDTGFNDSYVKVWKNGVSTTIAHTYERAYPSISVSGSDVYVTCSIHAASLQQTAMLWKNGVSIPLDNAYQAEPHSIWVSGSDVYVAGYSPDPTHTPYATLWKNGVGSYFADGSNGGNARSVFLFGSDIYVADNCYAINTGTAATKIWKNGILSGFLTDENTSSYAYSIFVKYRD